MQEFSRDLQPFLADSLMPAARCLSSCPPGLNGKFCSVISHLKKIVAKSVVRG
jgi:hypothetical protein